VRRHPTSVEQARGGENEGTGADRGDARPGVVRGADSIDEFARRVGVNGVARWDDDRVVPDTSRTASPQAVSVDKEAMRCSSSVPGTADEERR
jgi:hypothetical protein